jgi:hypothetical protein
MAMTLSVKSDASSTCALGMKGEISWLVIGIREFLWPVVWPDYYLINYEKYKRKNVKYLAELDYIGRLFGRFRYSSSETGTSAGLIEPIDRTHRGIRLVQQPEKEEGIPFLGTIAAGRPIEAVPQPEYLQVPDELLGRKPCYVLKVRGDSMIEEGILDGDYVVIEQRDSVNSGEIVVALVRNEEATNNVSVVQLVCGRCPP